MIDDLDKKYINFGFYTNQLVKDKNLISEYINGLTSKNLTFLENCFNALRIISEKNPDFLYSLWDFFINHIKSNDSYHKTARIIIISNLTSFDKKKRFESIFDKFHDNLKCEKTIVIIYLIKQPRKIVNSKLNLKEKITIILLNINSIHPERQLELLKSTVIELFSQYYSKIKNKEDIINFVEKQLNSNSLKDKKNCKRISASIFGEIENYGRAS